MALGLAHQAAHAQYNPVFDLSTIDGENGVVLNGQNTYDFAGTSVSNAGDINGDGIDDVIIGASGADPGGNSSAGRSYVVFGTDTGLPSPLNLAGLDGSDGIIINGASANTASGISVSAAGDFNGDGIDDLIIGARNGNPNGNSNAGSSYVVFGSDLGFTSPFNLSSVNGTNGIIINGASAGDRSGGSVSSAGDVNADGVDDLLLGAVGLSGFIGGGYVVYGNDVIFKNGFD